MDESTAKILVVEDETPVRFFLMEALRREDFQAIPASDVAEALNALDREPIDLILLDLHMPGSQDGEDLLFLLRDRGNQVPIIVVSGWVDDEATANQPDCVYAVMKKPVNADQLLATVRQALASA